MNRAGNISANGVCSVVQAEFNLVKEAFGATERGEGGATVILAVSKFARIPLTS
ncbi:hypothetical protein KCP75_19815 [Salmonella enterica subsp. enterica]|nr:hypothetical protein KCP75_19815 [Salmonella enterica subsp. enterica]